MRWLIGCECSGMVRDAFIACGHDAVSCDLKPTERPGPHIVGNLLDILQDGWDGLVAHPECTFVAVSGLHWTARGLRDPKLTLDAIAFAEALWDAPVPRIAIENPVGCLSTRSRLGKPTQTIQPWQFGDDASKRTCLWLRGLPCLVPTGPLVAPRMVNGKPRWANQTNSGQNRLGPSPTRSADRARTYPGIAKAMAEQWGVEA